MEEIRITHYINPHMFWFVRMCDCPPIELMKFEADINLHFKQEARSHFASKYKPKRGEIAAAFHSSKNHFIRVKIDEILNFGSEHTYLLWAIDHGIFFHSDVKWLRKLPTEFQNVDFDLIKFGGLQGVAPAELKYDYEEQVNQMVISENWSARAVEVMQKIIDDAEETHFKIELRAPNNQLFGNLTVATHKRKNVNLIDSLIKSQSAIAASNFMQVLLELKTRRFNRYEDNEGRVNLRFNENRHIVASNTNHFVSDDTAEAADVQEHVPDVVCDFDKIKDWQQRNDNFQQQQSQQVLADVRPLLIPAVDLEQPPQMGHYSVPGSTPNASKWQQNLYLRSNMPRRPHGAVDGVMNMLHDQDKASLDTSSDGQCQSLSEQMIMMRKNRIAATESMPKHTSKLAPTNLLPAGADLNASQRKKPVRPLHIASISSGTGDYQKYQRSGPVDRGAKLQANAPSSNYMKALTDERCMPNYLSGQLVLVHGKQIEMPAVLAKANFTLDVLRHMQDRNIGLFYRIQTYAWPHIMRRRSFVVVNSSQTGKTMCYVPAIVSLIQNAKEDGAITEGAGPTAVIVCPSACRAERLKRLLSGFRMDTAVAFGVRNLDNVLGRLLGGCDILVVTPPAFTRLYNMDRNVFVGRRIKHLVFDDMDLSLENFATDLDSIFTLCRQGNKDDFQLVVTSKTWRPVFGKLIDSCDAVLCIGAYIEAAAYGQCEFKLQLVESHKKTAMIMSRYVSNGRYEVEKTIVVCNDRAEVEQLVEQLKGHGVVCLWAHEDTSSEDLAHLESWNEDTKDKSMMVCSDKVLSALKVKRAKNLIHFSMPSLWSVFCYRFSVFFETYQDYTVAESRKAVNKQQQPATFVLLDERNSCSLPRLIEFLTKHYKIDLLEKILKLSKNIQIQRELAKRNGDGLVPLCSSFLEFARCFNGSDCSDRHVFTPCDLSKRPISRNIKLHILEIFSPVHYAARIIAQVVDGVWQTSKDNFTAFTIGLASYFGNAANHIIHYPVCLGDMCVIRDDDDMGFSRCEIVRIAEESELKRSNNRVKVKLIDSGQIVDCSSSELLALPPAYQKFPAQAIDVRLTGIIPLDFETDWNRNALATIKSWMQFDEKQRDTVSLQAQVRVSLRNTIWVDSLVVVEGLAAIGRFTKSDLKKSLVMKQFCQEDSRAIETLEEMILAVELNVAAEAVQSVSQPEMVDEKSEELSSSSPCENDTTSDDLERASSISIRSDVMDVGKESVINDAVAQPSKAVEKWCVIDDIECHNISLSLFEAPNSFYVQRADQLQGLIQLNDSIEEFLDSIGDKVVHKPENGLNCLVVFDEVVSRAKITELVDEDSVKLFLVDLGETQVYGRDELMKTNNAIVEKLPFLAIKCNMVGIRPKDGDQWTESVANAVYDEVIAPCKSLFVRVIRKSASPAPIDGMASYDVLLVDCTDEQQDVKINKKLVADGYAVKDPDSDHFMDLILSKRKELFLLNTDPIEADNEEDWDNDCKGKKRSRNVLMTEPHENFDDYEIDAFFDDDEVELLTRTAYPGAPENFSIDEAKKLQAAVEQPKEEALIREIQDASELDVVFEKKNSTLDSDDLTNPQNSEESENSDMPRLLAQHKYAKTKWQQNESLVRLEISAPDIKDYSLWVSNSLLQYIHTYADDTKPKEILNINLFGCIEPEWTSHEQRGLNVVVRLVKTIKGDAWPGLMFPTHVPFWLKFNFDSITDSKGLDMPEPAILPGFKLDEDDSDYEIISNDNDDDYDNFVNVLGD